MTELKLAGTLAAWGVATVLIAWPHGAAAESEEDASKVGRVLTLRGDVGVTAPGAPSERQLARGSWVGDGAVVRTGEDATVRLLMRDRSILVLGASSRVAVTEYKVSPRRRQVTMRVQVGRLWARVTKLFGGESTYDVEAPTAVAGIRGTDLVVDVAEDGTTTITCITGRLEVSPTEAEGPVTLESGQSGAVQPDGSVVTVTLSPEQLRALSDIARVRSHLDKDRSEDRQGSAGAGGGGQEGGASGSGDPVVESGAGTGFLEAPLDLDPGDAETTRVRGEFEVRQR